MGGCATFNVSIIVILFAIVKFEQLATSSNPMINVHVASNEYSSEDKLTLGDHDDFMMAFGLADVDF